MTISRRNALKGMLLAGVAATATTVASARERKSPLPGAMGMLYDTTRCIGCKTCVVACRKANDLAPVKREINGGVYDAPDDLSGCTKNIIKLYREDPYRSYMKAQCMHCVDPACSSACMLGSLHKDETTGVVGYDARYCVGCRYCQMACPFNIPKFEFSSTTPKIVKCELCRHLVKDAAAVVDGFTRYPKGQGPACCEVCPRAAVIYGRRDELLAEAKRRIAEEPGKYWEDRVYGETEGGGTQVLYLSHVPYERLGLPNLGPEGVPHTAYSVQEGLYRDFIAPVALYAGLVTVLVRNRKAGEEASGGDDRPGTGTGARS